MMQEIELLKLADTNTGIAWWDEARKQLNKAIKAYNKFLTKKDYSVSKLEKKVKKAYQTIKNSDWCVDYSSDFDVITKLLDDNEMDISWYSGF